MFPRFSYTEPMTVAAAKPDVRWWAPGDLNAFFGLITDNMTQLVLCVGLLAGFGMPAEFVLTRMLPGTALGVLVGDLLYAWMGARLSKRLGRPVTAMPLGIDTPSLFAVCFMILGPLYATYAKTLPAEAAAERAWKAGMALMVLSGILKLALAPFGNTVRRALPRAALLGPLAGVAVCLIAFLPMMEIFEHPVAGLLALGIVLATLVAGWRAPFGIPGALLAVVAATAVHYALGAPVPVFAHPHLTLPMPTLGFLQGFRDALPLLPLALPFALLTVVGGIDCVESAAAAGDEFDTRSILGVEGLATLAAGLCGGVIQTTPYIGHPAYKRMGGRSGYALATALFIGFGGALGVLGFFVALLPKAALVPILCFVGLEITAQAFRASPPRHAPAVALAFLPCVAYLLPIAAPGFPHSHAVGMLGNPGFFVTGLLWSASVCWMMDREAWKAVLALLLCGGLTLFGVIHSPLPGGALYWPWAAAGILAAHPEVKAVAWGYAAAAAAVGGMALFGGTRRTEEES